MTRQIMTVLVAMTLANSVLADDVRLKGAVRVDSDTGSVRLRDVAELVGVRAEALGDVVVGELKNHADTVEITLQQVRSALTAAGAHWGKLNLSGRDTVVRARVPEADAPQAMQAVSILNDKRGNRSAAESTVTGATDILQQQTLRGDLARFFVRHLKVRSEDLRLTFRPEDEEALRLSTGEYRFEKAPHGRIDNDVVELTVRVWQDQQVTRSFIIRVQVRVRTDVLVPKASITRGGRLDEAELITESRWLPAREAGSMARPGDLVGKTAASRLQPGKPIRRGTVAAPVVVKQGDDVFVRCLVGGLVISLKAEARADGATGDLVPMRKMNERSTFLARVTAPGEAVVDLSEPAPSPCRYSSPLPRPHKILPPARSWAMRCGRAPRPVTACSWSSSPSHASTTSTTSCRSWSSSRAAPSGRTSWTPRRITTSPARSRRSRT
jgi:flagella basal body P-ring formation protein FlgA